jgi:sulfonate transport system substrate-binding protein
LADFLARVRRHWDWYGAHLDVVQQIYIDKLKQTPDRAKYDAPSNAAVFRHIDDTLIAQEQHIAETLLQSGDIARRIDVSIEFSRAFNAATTGAA